MLIKLPEWLERTNNLRRTHVGIVKNNDDPKRLGRIKVEIPGLFKEADSPWVSANNPTFLGGSADSHFLVVPEVDSEVRIEFPYDDIYAPEYIGKFNTTPTRASELEANYPETYGFVDSTGTYIRINKATKVMEIHHASNTHIRIDAQGNVSLDNPKDITITNGGNTTVNTSGNTSINTAGDTTISTSGETNITSGGDINITAPTINMNP